VNSQLLLNCVPRATMGLCLGWFSITWAFPPGQPLTAPLLSAPLALLIVANLVLGVQAARSAPKLLNLWVGASVPGHLCWALASAAALAAHPPWASSASPFVGSASAVLLQWSCAAFFLVGVVLHVIACPRDG